MIDAMIGSDNMDFRTPPEFLELVRTVGLIGLDPATDDANPVKALRCYVGGVNDGLQFNWRDEVREEGGLVYCNPPYGRALGKWAEKFADEGDAGCELITLTPSRTGSSWVHGHMVKATSMRFLKRRLTFWSKVEPWMVGDFSAIRSLEPRGWHPGAWDKKKKRWSVAPAPFDCMVCYWGPRAAAFDGALRAVSWKPGEKS